MPVQTGEQRVEVACLQAGATRRVEDGRVRIERLELAADRPKCIVPGVLDAGIVDTPSCKLLVINGMEDSISPIKDSLIVAIQGHKTDLVARDGRGHMGKPCAEDVLYAWIDSALAGAP